MIGCILTGHGTFANGLADALSMIAGDQDYFIPVPFIEAGAASYPETLASTISDLLPAVVEPALDDDSSFENDGI